MQNQWVGFWTASKGPASEGPQGKLDSVAGWLWATLVLVTLWRVWAAWMLPVTQDEAYYFDWARSLAWGYFDHPPAVALFGIGTRLAPAAAFAGRLGTILAATLLLVVLVRLYRACNLRGNELVVAAVVACATLPGLASGVLATPDTALGLAWALALHEGLAALRGERRRWLSAGIAIGLGLLSKYTMVLIGPVFLGAILWADPKALRTPWPYLGGLLALLVFSPNLLWNAQNDWLTIRFQFGHGFSTETGTLVTNSLPVPTGDHKVATTLSSEHRSVAEGLGGLLDFLGTQIALWGLLALPAIAGLFRGHRAGPKQGLTVFDPAARALLVTGSLFPLAFFALVATFSEVEPNWPVIYLSAAAPLVALTAARLRMWVLAAAGGNLLLVGLYVLHGSTGSLPLPDGYNRILRETHGYSELAQRVATLPGPLFSDRYQIVAMTRFYAPHRQITQWPGISRPSEYLRGTIAPTATRKRIEQAGGFWYLGRRVLPMEIPGFSLRSQNSLYYCMNGGLVETPTGAARPCPDPLHRWQLFAYTADGMW
ncbi:ArnT family glycosyltransferase [Candidatus Thiosymbion oneisti]|uniref:ArnT family glycosyltransferase n=1 Tax=Candidatus Thiosymbion oneisti TaxID=589554 RepID=UPI000B7EBC27|nr:glycosyltransferase family 39 protein [Candidatus Thiosymbion oneisti]